jgi:uncharacterized membrane protein YeaQ/YmgE (transglycosylase-associated protein family)
MSLIAFAISAAIWGLIVGALARLALPGRDPMSIPATIAVGMGGSLIAGVIVYLLSDRREGPGFFAAFCGAVLIVYIIRRSRGGGLTSPGGQGGNGRDKTRGV